jgi:hypothetical protein
LSLNLGLRTQLASQDSRFEIRSAENIQVLSNLLQGCTSSIKATPKSIKRTERHTAGLAPSWLDGCVDSTLSLLPFLPCERTGFLHKQKRIQKPCKIHRLRVLEGIRERTDPLLPSRTSGRGGEPQKTR